MEANPNIPSLLPYLQADQGRFALTIMLGGHDAKQPLNGESPFLIYSEEDSLSRLVGATLVSDTGATIKALHMRIQKDAYTLFNPTLAPLTNTLIDKTWQRAYESQAQDAPAGRRITLAQQLDGSGRLQPFNALFFCRLRSCWFHPPCPTCGTPLSQCHDEQLLQQAQLQPYGASLARYLYCHTCHSRGTPAAFYAFERRNQDPDWLRDRRQLIFEFGQLPPETAHFSHIPCPTCPNHPLCYGQEGLVETYLAFLSFYPFYALFSEAGSLPAADFLNLVSGAEIPDLLEAHDATGSASAGAALRALPGDESVPYLLLDPGDPRHFLEVLYLKLKFLEQLARDVGSQLATSHYPDLGLAFDSIWIQISENEGQLPYLWNFRVLRNDIGRHMDAEQMPLAPPAYGLHLLGLTWFYTLAANPRQGISDLHPVINRLAAAQDDLAAYLAAAPASGLPPELAPSQILWHPHPEPMTPEYDQFWQNALALGGILIQTSLNPGHAWSEEQFFQELNELQGRVRDHLLTAPAKGATMTAELAAAVPDDAPMHRILEQIAAKWQQRLLARPSAPHTPPAARTPAEPSRPAPAAIPDPGSVETVIISGAPPAQSPAPPQGDLAETVILPRNGQPARKAAPQESKPAPSQGRESDFRRTPPTAPTPRPASAPPGEAEDLAETVILPRGNRPGTGGGTGPQNKPEAQQPPATSPAAGVPLRTFVPQTGRESSPRHPPDQPVDGDLAETVVLSSSPRHKQDPDAPRQQPANLWQKPKPLSGAPPGGTADRSSREATETQPPPAGDNDDDDLLMETVVLRPGKDKR